MEMDLLLKPLRPSQQHNMISDRFEKKARRRGFKAIAGIDEAGRGPLAGPVVAAACMLPKGALIEGIDDSKKLTPEKRMEVYEKIIAYPQVCFGIGIIDSIIIDQINILRATLEAMMLAVAHLSNQPDYLLVDGNQLPPFHIPAEAIVDGDALSFSIAAASIIAKYTRDKIMMEYHLQWPMYGFDEHKGYGTEKHLLALQKEGPCPIHRRSFEPVKCLLVGQ